MHLSTFRSLCMPHSIFRMYLQVNSYGYPRYGNKTKDLQIAEELPAPPFSLRHHICSTITGWWRFFQMLYLSTECWGLRVAFNLPRTGFRRSPTPPTYLSTVSRAFSPDSLWHTRYTIRGMSHFTQENNGAVNPCNILHKSTPRHNLPRLKWGWNYNSVKKCGCNAEWIFTCGTPSQSSACCMASRAFSTGWLGSHVCQSGQRPEHDKIIISQYDISE